MNNKIAIAGLGWLGLPLAKNLLQKGYQVKGSVSSLEKATKLNKNLFEAYPILISEGGLSGEVKAMLSNSDVLLVMIPPGLRRNTGSDYVLKMVHLLEAIEKFGPDKVVFISSTSVYGDNQGKVTEKNIPIPETEAGKQLLQVEQLFFNASFIKTSIVRFGGLYGGSRQPVRFLAGREGLSNGDAPVNLIHREDCIRLISEILKQDAFGHIFNAVHPQHPFKRDYYVNKATELGLEPPIYEANVSGENYKQVDSVNLDEILEFQFKQTIL